MAAKENLMEMVMIQVYQLMKKWKKKNEEVTVNEIGKKRKRKGPVFDPKAVYSWRLCNTRSKHNYMPCIDNDGLIGMLQSYRHRERSCPKKLVMCLVPLPHDCYDPAVSWPEV